MPAVEQEASRGFACILTDHLSSSKARNQHHHGENAVPANGISLQGFPFLKGTYLDFLRLKDN